MLEVIQALFWLGFAGCLLISALLLFVVLHNAISSTYYIELDPKWGFWFLLVFSVTCMTIGGHLMLPS